MNRSYRVEALVIKKSKIRESDSQLTFITSQRGKIVVVARGLRKITSRKAPFLDLFNHLFVYLSYGRNYDIISDIEPINSFPNIRKDLLRVACAFKLSELVIRLLPEKENHLTVFNRLLSDFINLNKYGPLNEKEIVRDFGNFLLSELGYKEKNNNLSDKNLDSFLEEIMEKKINTNDLLEKLV